MAANNKKRKLSESTEDSILICPVCDQKLSSPIVLPCGETICEKHINENLTGKNKKSIQCPIEDCNQKHSIPTAGFIINKRLQKLLQEAEIKQQKTVNT